MRRYTDEADVASALVFQESPWALSLLERMLAVVVEFEPRQSVRSWRRVLVFSYEERRLN